MVSRDRAIALQPGSQERNSLSKKKKIYPHFKGKETEAWEGHQLAHSPTASNCKLRTDTWLSLPYFLWFLLQGVP